jgi:DNA-binding CsgD family transcriptional regulator
MSIWNWLLSWIGLRTDTRSRSSQNTKIRLQVSQIAEREGRPEPEIVTQLLVAGLQKYYSRMEVMSKWESLSPRQKEVAILIEKGMTNEEIAKRLSISNETIKTHVANILRKFSVNEKSEVRHMLRVMKKNHWI